MNALGELRPSQLIYTFGVGSLVDLPHMSVVILGLDDWEPNFCTEIVEERLLAMLKNVAGKQLTKLLQPPIRRDDENLDPNLSGYGVPIAAFPRWLRCPTCNSLASIESGVFQLHVDRYRPDRTRYVHLGCSRAKNPNALPVRFLMACREGHITDFPWINFVHGNNKPCKPSRLTLREFGAAGDASDIEVRCLDCNAHRRMGEAFDKDRFSASCTGHYPHLRTTTPDCPEESRTILLGASNSWFPVVLSALSLPQAEDKLGQLIEDRWNDLKDVPSLDVLTYLIAPSRMPAFAGYDPETVWNAIESKKTGGEKTEDETLDLKGPEWAVFCAADPDRQSTDFKLRKVRPPGGFEDYFEDTVLVERIREVRALLGFTRIESRGDFAEADRVDDERLTKLSREDPLWLPASEVRGEGIFLRLKEDKIKEWEKKDGIGELSRKFFDSHKSWRKLRKIEPSAEGFPGTRFILLHSLAHALMRQLVLECGYTAASIRERIYSSGGSDPMAGIIVYTAASDSEGTLGGLVEQGESLRLGRHLSQALESLGICASDPLCAENDPGLDGRGVHAACCHACLFSPETSCERGNRYLDRGVLIPLINERETNFFV